MRKDASDLVLEFADSIIKKRQAIKHGTAREARRYGKRETTVARKLVRMGEEGTR